MEKQFVGTYSFPIDYDMLLKSIKAWYHEAAQTQLKDPKSSLSRLGRHEHQERPAQSPRQQYVCTVNEYTHRQP